VDAELRDCYAGRMHVQRYFTILFVSLFLTSCGGKGELGDGDTPSSKDECVDGAVCSNDGDSNHCRKLCTDQAQCGSNESCNGISGSSLKSCQPKA
jgi:hypothetical protein